MEASNYCVEKSRGLLEVDMVRVENFEILKIVQVTQKSGKSKKSENRQSNALIVLCHLQYSAYNIMYLFDT